MSPDYYFLMAMVSHLTYEFLEFGKQNSLIPYCFPSHTTHLIQPLDGQQFQVYTYYYRKWNNFLAGLGVETDDKGAFFKGDPRRTQANFQSADNSRYF